MLSTCLRNEGSSGAAPARWVRLAYEVCMGQRVATRHRKEFAVLRLEEGVHGCSLIACNDLQQEKTVGNAR